MAWDQGPARKRSRPGGEWCDVAVSFQHWSAWGVMPMYLLASGQIIVRDDGQPQGHWHSEDTGIHEQIPKRWVISWHLGGDPDKAKEHVYERVQGARAWELKYRDGAIITGGWKTLLIAME